MPDMVVTIFFPVKNNTHKVQCGSIRIIVRILEEYFESTSATSIIKPIAM
jgi:hypothetical protein